MNEVLDSSVTLAASYEKLGIVGVSFILFVLMGAIAYFLLRKILDSFDNMKEIVKNNKAIEDLFKELKQEFATNNKFLRYLIENQKYANEVYERMIEKTLSELRLEMIDLKEKYNPSGEGVSKKEKYSSKADALRQEIYSLGSYCDISSHRKHSPLDDD